MPDTTFITNQNGETLLDRFKILVKDTKYFDCLVGYFYASGFASLSESLQNTEKIRILIGLSTDKQTYDLIQYAQTPEGDSVKSYSSREMRDNYARMIRSEMDNSEDTFDVEKSVKLFIEWIQSGKLEVKVYRSQDIHAKVYIMKFQDADRDYGRVITGSSNFSHSGLEANLEFNVELKERADYDYAHDRFEELWKDAVDVSEEFVQTIEKQTWLSTSITPYQLYLKFLYEYLKEQINQDLEEREVFLPDGYMELQYQKDAVTDAIQKLDEYGGVFISDVVGLGKTYITALLLKTLNAPALVLAPPVLVDRKNPGSWTRVLEDFGVPGCYCASVGNLDKIPKEADLARYKYVVIDEAHKFRNENTQMYDSLYKICLGKKIILVTATPLNNSPMDILAQIKLFQPAHASTLPNPETYDLEEYFRNLQRKLNGLDRQKNKKEYLKVVRENAEKIRNDILQYLMVRRTRSSIVKYYQKDLEKQGLRFPEVADPTPLYYEFDEKTDEVFNKSIERIVKGFKYARYTPLLYLKVKDEQRESGQKNMMKFMRILLLKRLESSFYAFKMSVNRMIYSYEKFIEMYKSGTVYTSDSSVKNLMTLLEEENFEKIESLIDEDRVQEHSSDEFKLEYLDDLENDLQVLKSLKEDWGNISKDPKIEKFVKTLRVDQNMKDKKVLIFTEAKETADYLKENLENVFGSCVLSISGSSDPSVRQTVIDNFDGKVKEEDRSDDYRILIATEVLSEGVNLHRSNVVVNYDIPWNPVRMIQRVGRINRVDTKFDTLYIYNFFPTAQINDETKLKELAVAKIEAFIEMLGNDAKLLTDEEVKSHDLFNKLSSRKTITGEDDEDVPELKYLTEIRKIRDEDKELYREIQNLPKKARVARKGDVVGLITFFRKGKLRKIYQGSGSRILELDFATAAEKLKADVSEKALGSMPESMYNLLESNKAAFTKLFMTEYTQGAAKKGIDAKLRKYVSALISNSVEFTDIELEYVRGVLTALDAGTIPKYTITEAYKEIKNSGLLESPSLYRMVFSVLRKYIDSSMILRGKISMAEPTGISEVILSEYFGV